MYALPTHTVHITHAHTPWDVGIKFIRYLINIYNMSKNSELINIFYLLTFLISLSESKYFH